MFDGGLLLLVLLFFDVVDNLFLCLFVFLWVLFCFVFIFLAVRFFFFLVFVFAVCSCAVFHHKQIPKVFLFPFCLLPFFFAPPLFFALLRSDFL